MANILIVEDEKNMQTSSVNICTEAGIPVLLLMMV